MKTSLFATSFLAVMPSDGLNQNRLSNADMSAAAACPICGKQSIVRRSLNTFDCLNCNFHKDFPPLDQSSLVDHKPVHRPVHKPVHKPVHGPVYGPNSPAELAEDPDGERRFLSAHEQRQLPFYTEYTEAERRRMDSLQRPGLDRADKADLLQPLLFAAIAVIIGLLLL